MLPEKIDNSIVYLKRHSRRHKFDTKVHRIKKKKKNNTKITLYIGRLVWVILQLGIQRVSLQMFVLLHVVVHLVYEGWSLLHQ